MANRLLLATLCTIFATAALAPSAGSAAPLNATINVNTMPAKIVSTIANVMTDENGKGATIYADLDPRAMRLPETLVARLGELTNAEKNRWEVAIELETTGAGPFYAIKSFAVKSSNTHLTTGFNMPDTEFRPLQFDDYSNIQKLFRSVFPYKANDYNVDDNCFNRAHYWSRMHQVTAARKGTHAGTDKVFILFTKAYQQQYGHRWWFHVAPVVYHGDRSHPIVLDPTFMDGPEKLRDWLSAFDHFTNGNCQRIENMRQFIESSNEPICMYSTVSMFSYTPHDLNNPPTNWRCRDFRNLVNQIPAPNYGSWDDAKNAYVVPEMCGGPAVDPSNPQPPPPTVPDRDENRDENTDPRRDPYAGTTGRIHEASANLRQGPGTNFPIVSSYPRGTTFKVVRNENGWFLVRLPDGTRGYFAGSVFEIL